MDVMGILFVGAGVVTVGILITTVWYEFTRKQNNKTHFLDNELQSKIDEMSPREFYTRKMSQTNLIWDPRTQAYIRKWSKNDTTFH